MHCGLCIETCPTYKVSGIESDSPRGRLLLMRAVHEDRLELSDIQPALERCVQCHACESSCPSNVDYSGLLLENLNARKSFTAKVMASKTLSNLAGIALRLLSRLKLYRLPGLSMHSKAARGLMLCPEKASAFDSQRTIHPALGELRGKVALQLGCVERQIHGTVLNDLISVFTHQGFELHIPPQQNCCGAIHYHSGDIEHGKDLAESSSQQFANFENVIVLSAGCSAHLQRHSNTNIYFDPLIFLAKHGLRGDLNPINQQVAWMIPCHLKHLHQDWQMVGELLESIPQLKIVDVDDSDLCCGAGGTAMLSQPHLSAEMGQAKAQCLVNADPQQILSSNVGCRIQIDAHLRMLGSDQRTTHPISLLRFALGIDKH